MFYSILMGSALIYRFINVKFIFYSFDKLFKYTLRLMIFIRHYNPNILRICHHLLIRYYPDVSSYILHHFFDENLYFLNF